jgi:hypothetical protein
METGDPVALCERPRVWVGIMGNVAYLFGAAPIIPVSVSPTVGYYYQVVKGDTPWAISKKAYQDQGLATVKAGLMLMNDNPANSHIQKAKTGWESYNVKGLQFNPKYAPGDADATAGSGKAYPLVWIPPLDGRTPGQMGGGGTGPQGPAGQAGKVGPAGPMGPAGPVGPIGPMGPAGPVGPMPDDAKIKALISDFMDENPISGKVSASDLAKAVSDYIKANPVAQGPMGPAGPVGPMGPAGPMPSDAKLSSLISDFMDKHPTSGQVSASDLSKAVSDYLATHPVAQGARGPAGPQGPPGPMGPAGSDSSFDMAQAREFVDARIRLALRDFKPETGGGTVQTAGFNDWLGVFAAGIAASALLGALMKTRRSRKKPLKNLLSGPTVKV